MVTKTNSAKLTKASYRQGIRELTAQDAQLSNIIAKWGEPPFWVHDKGFPGLVIAILAQQVSLESAQATFVKLEGALGTVEPEGVLPLDDTSLKTIGFSRQKASYVRGIAHGIVEGGIRIPAIDSMDDHAAREYLMNLRGIGAWTADVYLLFSLRRPDAWPSGDLALAKAIQEIEGLAAMPEWSEVNDIATRWRPWRAVAARMLWHDYLCRRGRSAPL